MSAITVSSELGSHGSAIAEKVAQALNYHLTDKNTIEAILKDYGMTDFKDEYDTIPGFWDRFNAQHRDRRQNVLSMLNHSLCALAQHGDVVIVGRGGFAVLGGLGDVLNVRVQAPWELRVRRMMELTPATDTSRAEQMLLENDYLQQHFVKSVHGADWDTASAFDLVIDTAKINPDLAADMIVRAANAMILSGYPDERSTANLEVDHILTACVEDVLNPVGASSR
jgi:cytidylate kinase